MFPDYDPMIINVVFGASSGISAFFFGYLGDLTVSIFFWNFILKLFYKNFNYKEIQSSSLSYFSFFSLRNRPNHDTVCNKLLHSPGANGNTRYDGWCLSLFHSSDIV